MINFDRSWRFLCYFALSLNLLEFAFNACAEDNTAGSVPVVASYTSAINWPEFISQQDLIWNRLPTNYFDGPFVGNGLLGTIIYKDDQLPNSLRFEIGRTDVYDHRNVGSALQYQVRMPIGQLLLTPVGKITETHLRMDLWNAEIRGDISTEVGKIHLRCFTPSKQEVIVIEISTNEGEKGAKFSLRPQQATSPRYLAQPTRDKGFVYMPNPPFELKQSGDMEVCTQPLAAGSDYATAWKEVGAINGTRTVYLTVANRLTTMGSEADAVSTIQKAIGQGVPAMEKEHREWWHTFYQSSFLSLADKRLESFYWIQLYKIASATREDRPVVDLMGPWFKVSVWAAYWNNLNTQLSYYPELPENHPELSEALCRFLESNVQNLTNNCPPEFREDSAALGTVTSCYGLVSAAPGPPLESLKKGAYRLISLPWLMQEFYLQYRYTMDEQRLRTRIYPLLRRTFNTYLHIISLGSDGYYHIPMAFSDEYGNAEDTSLNLALLRWGLQTLLQTAHQLKIEDPLIPKWQEVLDKLVDYPVDETGIMIGKATPFSKPHRHSSHLFAIFPLHVLNIDDEPERRPLMELSIKHFLSFNGDDCMFKFTGASSLNAAIGNGDEALTCLQRALAIQAKGPTVTPNTLYSEGGWQTFESPESASRCILDMLIQSWGKSIRLFPACPAAWKDVSFDNLRAQGAFLVSAARKDGHTQFIRIKSLAGQPCRIHSDLASPVKILSSTGTLLHDEAGMVELSLPKDGEAILYSGENPPDLTIKPVLSFGSENDWGLR